MTIIEIINEVDIKYVTIPSFVIPAESRVYALRLDSSKDVGWIKADRLNPPKHERWVR